MSAYPWLEYRPEALEFFGGGRVEFPADARMLYNEEDNVILLENPGHLTGSRLASYVADHAELKRIEYSMLVDVDGRQRRLGFYHPLNRGADVRLSQNDQGDIFFFNTQGRPLFTKDWTLREVSRGTIPSNRAVWQFHGYKHEH
jgi:hypothetical protein